MITNKEKFPEIKTILERLEIALKKDDNFSASILLTRLKNLGYKIEKSCTETENSVK